MRKGFSRLGRFTPTPPSPTFARLRIAKAILYGKRANVVYQGLYEIGYCLVIDNFTGKAEPEVKPKT